MFPVEFLRRILSGPLKRRMRLGHEIGDADGDIKPRPLFADFAVDFIDSAGDLCDAVQILIGLAGQAIIKYSLIL